MRSTWLQHTDVHDPFCKVGSVLCAFHVLLRAVGTEDTEIIRKANQQEQPTVAASQTDKPASSKAQASASGPAAAPALSSAPTAAPAAAASTMHRFLRKVRSSSIPDFTQCISSATHAIYFCHPVMAQAALQGRHHSAQAVCIPGDHDTCVTMSAACRLQEAL